MKTLQQKSKKQKLTLNKDFDINLQTNEESTLEVTVDKLANVNITSIIHAKGNDKYSLDYKIIHKYPDTKSKSIFKVVVEDEARFDFVGLIKVLNGAKETDAYLQVDVLILSDDAKVKAIPSLEIEEKEVKASHGATITKIDEEQLFYLTSRGISIDKAKQLIVEGFLK